MPENTRSIHRHPR
uniref:Uncharacterized protein n=1 Tax=Rhizophora mucronata TaxID=61149 RepID=A0A2P2PYF0_RHIMU